MKKSGRDKNAVSWNRFYAEGAFTQHYPSEQVVRGLRRLFPTTAPKPKGLKVLDWGCGNGRNLPVIFDVFPKGNEIHLIDISGVAVRGAKRIGGKRIKKALVGSVEKTAFDSGFFDVIIDDGTTHHTKNPDKALREMLRILKPGGKVVTGFMAAGSWWKGSSTEVPPIIHLVTPRGKKAVIYQDVPKSGPETGIPQNYISTDSVTYEYLSVLGFTVTMSEIFIRKSRSYEFIFLWANLEKRCSADCS
jgi:SAM-dependent methyltransferase